MADNIASLGVGIDFDPAAISALNAMMRDGVRVGIDPREITKIDQILAKQRSAATQIFSQAIKQGSMHLAKDLEKTVREHNQLAVSLATKTAELHRKAEDATLSAIQRKTAKIDLESAKRAMKSLDEEFKVRTTREQELLDTQKEHIEEMLKLKAKESGPLGGAATAAKRKEVQQLPVINALTSTPSNRDVRVHDDACPWPWSGNYEEDVLHGTEQCEPS